MSNIYSGLLRKYKGDVYYIDDLIPYSWERISHFYRDYYVFQYATSYCASVALASGILENPKNVHKYINFLKSGRSKYPIDLLKDAGIDMSSSEPIEKAMELFSDLVNEFEKNL